MVGAIYDFFTLSDQVQIANMRLMLNDPQFKGGRLKPRGAENWRYGQPGDPRRSQKKNLEQSILGLAKENKGILTVSEVSLATDVELEEVKKALDTLVSKGFAELRVRKSGTLVYTLPEFMDKDGGLENF